jgi:hypothetical protein
VEVGRNTLKKNATLKTKKAYLNLKRHDGPGCEIGKT